MRKRRRRKRFYNYDFLKNFQNFNVLFTLRIGIFILGLTFLFEAFILFYNNSSLSSTKNFSASLEKSLDKATDWIIKNKNEILTNSNIALLKMLDDCNNIHANKDFSEIVNIFMSYPLKPDCWKALIESDRIISGAEINETFNKSTIDNKWALYAIGGDKIDTGPEQLDLFNLKKWKGRKLTHQLWALIHFRERNPSDEKSEEVINHLCSRITKELCFDFAVVDIYIQKIAFVIGAGKSEKIRRRWIERVIANQEKDGGWDDRWFCFTSGRRPVFSLKSTANSHATIQALWLLYQVKYKYPEYYGLASNDAINRAK